MDASILLDLERAELAARERRLSAEAEAERLLADARARVAKVEAGVDAAITEAIAERRAALEQETTREINAIDRELTAVAPVDAAAVDDPAFREAVWMVVAAVLDEPRPASVPEARD